MAEEGASGLLKEWRRFFRLAWLPVRFPAARPTMPPASGGKLKRLARSILLPWLNRYLFGYYDFVAERPRR